LFKGVKKNLKTIKKCHKTKSGPALVAGTGPSLGEIPTDVLEYFAKQRALFGVNDYALSEKGMSYPPVYQVICDEYFWHPETNPSAAKLKEITQKNLKSSSTLCIIQPYFKEELIEHSENLFINTNSLPSFTKSINISKTTGLPPMTTHFAIATAIYLGYSPIYTVGFDLNQFLSLKIINEKLVTQKTITNGQNINTENTFWKTRETVSDFLSFTAHCISSMKLFENSVVVTLGENSMVDSLKKISFDDLKQNLKIS
jgi:hypothetical protein